MVPLGVEVLERETDDAEITLDVVGRSPNVFRVGLGFLLGLLNLIDLKSIRGRLAAASERS